MTFEIWPPSLHSTVQRDEGGGDMWVATCPSIDCGSQGATANEAKDNLREAAALWFTSCIYRGTLKAALEPQPEPRHPAFVEHDGEFINVSKVEWAVLRPDGYVEYFHVGENVGENIDNPNRAKGQLAAKLLAALRSLA